MLILFIYQSLFVPLLHTDYIPEVGNCLGYESVGSCLGGKDDCDYHCRDDRSYIAGFCIQFDRTGPDPLCYCCEELDNS